MPCGLGQHPYFPCGADTRIETEVTHRVRDRRACAAGRRGAGDRTLRSSRPAVCGQGLDHGFGGWGGTALLSDPAWPAALRLSSAAGALLPALFAGDGRHLRRRAGHPRQCRAQRAEGALGRARDAGAGARRDDAARHAAGAGPLGGMGPDRDRHAGKLPCRTGHHARRAAGLLHALDQPAHAEHLPRLCGRDHAGGKLLFADHPGPECRGRTARRQQDDRRADRRIGDPARRGHAAPASTAWRRTSISSRGR